MDNNGEQKRNVMQLIHGCYNLQINHEVNEYKGMWQKAVEVLGLDLADHPFHTMPAPILTRWWYVGVSDTFFT